MAKYVKPFTKLFSRVIHMAVEAVGNGVLLPPLEERKRRLRITQRHGGRRDSQRKRAA